MKYVNKIKYVISRLYNNIKYILTRELIDVDMLDVVDDRVHYLEDKVSTLLNDVDTLLNDIDDKCNEYQVEDVIYNLMGSSEDYINYDDMNDIKHDIKDINKKLNIIIDEDLKTIENKLFDINNVVDDNIFIDNNKRLNLKEWDLLVNDIIKSIINRLRYDGDNDNV